MPIVNNLVCPYCLIALNDIPNHPHKSAREHLIAERFFSAKRGMGHADFNCCRKCNADKSAMDYIFAAVSRLQSSESISKEEVEDVLQDKRKINRFLKAFGSAQSEGELVRVSFPASPGDILSYLDFLAKGQYFLTTGYFLTNSKLIYIPDMYCRGLLDRFDNYYKSGSGTKFEDLKQNPYSQVLGNGEVIAWAKGLDFVFCLNETIMLGGRIVQPTRANMRKRDKNIARIRK